MNEVYRNWLCKLYDREIQEQLDEIKNEELWNLGYVGNPDENPHPNNIKLHQDYVVILRNLKSIAMSEYGLTTGGNNNGKKE
mgnify:CR=1 FL=1|nr:MAG TPA: hypothetical protein [Caudoviricetes sp.]